MAFCIIEKEHRKAFQLLVNQRINKDITSLKDFKKFSKDIFSFLISKGQSTERAITLVKYLPQAVSDYSNIAENRKTLRTNGISLDQIADVEDLFSDYKNLAAYLGVKNEVTPVVLVNDTQLSQQKKVGDFVSSTKIEFVGNERIVNGQKMTTRVTSIAKVGFESDVEEDVQFSPALKHGNTIDTIAKNIFDDVTPSFSEFSENISEVAFNSVVAKLKEVKSELEGQGFVFKTGVTVFNKELGISGEIDLLAISPEGKSFIMDFKTANQRFNEPYLKTDILTYKSEEIKANVKILSKWSQYVTQGYIYGQLLADQLGIQPIPQVGIIGINISYDASVPLENSKIESVVEIQIHNIPYKDVRPEFKDKGISQIKQEYEKLEKMEKGPVIEFVSNTPKKREKYKDLGEEKPLERMAKINDVASTSEEFKKEVDWFVNNPIGKDTLLRIDDIVNSGLWGQFTLDGIILHERAAVGTVYHEGWHRFSQIFMGKQDKIDLYNSVKNDNISFVSRDSRKLNTSTASFLDIEEFLAEEFAKYALNPSAYKYPTSNAKPKSLFQRIWEFLQRYFGINPRPIDLFQKLYKGKVRTYIPSVNNAFWGKLNSISTNKFGDQIVSSERFPVYKEVMDGLIADQLDTYGKSPTALKQSKILQANVFNNVFAILNDKLEDPSLTDEQYSELKSILSPNNRYPFLRMYLRFTEYDSLKDLIPEENVLSSPLEEIATLEEMMQSSDYQDDDIPDDIDAQFDASKPELFTPDANEKSAVSLADSSVADFLRMIPKIKKVSADGTIQYELNEFGYKRYHKYYDIFNKTKKILSGAFEMSDMLERMSDPVNQRNFPELKIINDKFQFFLKNPTEKNFYRNIQNIQFIQAFHSIMSMPEVDNMQLTINYLPLTRKYKTLAPTIVNFNVLSRNLAVKIVETWDKNFKDKRGKTLMTFDNFDQTKSSFLKNPLYLTDDNKIVLNPFFSFSSFSDGLESVMNPNSTVKGLKDFFEVVGISFNEKAYTDRDAVKEMREFKANLIKNIDIVRAAAEPVIFSEVSQYLLDNKVDVSKAKSVNDLIQLSSNLVVNEVAKSYFITSPISAFRDSKKYDITDGRRSRTEITKGLRFDLESLAAIEEKFGDRVSSGSFRIEDKTKYPYYIPSLITTVTELVNQTQSFGDFFNNPYISRINPARYKWMARSFFIKNMYDDSGARKKDINGKDVKIFLGDFASVKTINVDENDRLVITEKAPKSLLVDEKFFADTLSLFSYGALEIPRAETSSTSFFIKLSDYGKGKQLPFTVTESLSQGLPERFHSVLFDYFASEIEKRQWWIENEPNTKAANKQPFSQQFGIFQDMLSPELISKVEKYLDLSPEEIFEKEDIKELFRKETTTYFDGQINNLIPKFNAFSEQQQKALRDTAKAKNLQSLSSLVKTFVINQFILKNEFYMLYFGDLSFYKNAFKRGKFVSNTGNPFYIDGWRNDLLNSVQDSTLHSIYNGVVKPKDFRFLKTAIINDVEIQSSYTSSDDRFNILLQDVINMRVASGSLIVGTPEYSKFIEDTKKGLEKYSSINVADGQGIIGMDFYRNFSIITNLWSPEKEDQYKRQKAIFRKHYDLYFKIDESGNKVRLEGEELEQARNEDNEWIDKKINAFFNPLKISYTGPQAKDGPMRPVFDKFSVRPILPEAAIGTRDEAMLLEMAKKDIDYLKFKSGSKVYQDEVFDWFKKISDGKYDMDNFSVGEITPNQLFAGFLKHQLNTEGLKEENILGSQFRNIVYGVKYSPLVKNNDSLVSYFSKLESQFIGSIRELIDIERRDLFSLLGVEKKNKQYVVTDVAKFISLLKDESLKRGVAVNNIDYLQYDPVTKQPINPIDYAFNRQQIQDLLSGLLDDRLRRLKINGAPLIQVSSAGFEKMENKGKFKNPTREDILKYGTNGLHYYHVIYENGVPVRTSTMGVKVALTKDFEKLLNLDAPESIDDKKRINIKGLEKPLKLKIRTLERLNEAMKDPKWKAEHMEKFIMIGYRIPTQNNNFIDHMEIMEFLPPAAGAIIIGPPEMIIKSGSDYDIDKMNIIKPSFLGGGRYATRPTENLNEIEQEISKLIFTERDAKFAKNQLELILQKSKVDIDKLEELQWKIRFTILDLARKASISSKTDMLVDSILEDVLEKIEENIATGRRYVVPERGVPEEEAFTEQEILLYEEVYQDTLDKYAILDSEINRVREKYGEAIKENLTIQEGMKWFNKRKDLKKAINNEILTNLSQTLSHPTYFELLVTPSSASMFETWTNELIASKEKMSDEMFAEEMEKAEGKLFDRPKSALQFSEYQASLEAFDNLLSRRKDLGGYAIMRTFADKFEFVKLSIAKEYAVKSGKEVYTKTLFTPLMTKEERKKSIVNGRIAMYGESVTGIPIRNTADQLVSLTVDLAGAPAYPKLGITNYNRKQYQYLIHQRNDPKKALWLMNQPILVDLFKQYENKRNTVEGYTIKHAIVEMALKLKILDNPPRWENAKVRKYEVYKTKKVRVETGEVDEVGNPIYKSQYNPDYSKANNYLSRPYVDLHLQNLSEEDVFTFEQLDKSIRENDRSSDFQKKVLAYFASITEEADWLLKLQFANNVDTNKYSTLVSILRNEGNRLSVKNSGLFDISQINMLEKESMISPFDYTQEAKSIMKALFPKLYTDGTIETFAKLIDDIFGARNLQIERVSKIIENDFIEFIYKNYGTYEGKNMSEVFEPLLINTDNTPDHDFFSNEMYTILSDFPELLDVPFVSKLSENIYNPPFNEVENSYKELDNKEIRNIFLLRNPDNPTMDKNIFTDNWRNLINFNPQKLGITRPYTQDEVQKISSFFHKMVFFSLYQAGLTNTGNGFSDLIPYEYWSAFIKQAFINYENQKKQYPALEEEMLRMFEFRFKQMNPNINWRTKDYEVDVSKLTDEQLDILEISQSEVEYLLGAGKKKEIPFPFYKNYFRGKDYLITDSDLGFVRDYVLVDTPQAEPVKSDFAIEVGRYVQYKDSIYIITKQVSGNNVWQIYNPTMTGPSAKISVSVRNLIPLNKKGSVVVFGEKSYLVTEKDMIIDLDNNRPVNWPKDSESRKRVLDKARTQNPESPTDGLPPIDPC